MSVKMLFTALLLSGIAVIATAAAPLENGDFFQRNDRNEPSAWRIRHTLPEDAAAHRTVSAENEVLRISGAPRGELLLIQPDIRLEPDQSYRVEFEARAIGEGGAANLRIYIQYQRLDDGKIITPVTVNGQWRRLSGSWEKNSFEIDFPANGRSPWFVINVSGSGTVEIRNLSVEIMNQK